MGFVHLLIDWALTVILFSQKMNDLPNMASAKTQSSYLIFVRLIAVTIAILLKTETV